MGFLPHGRVMLLPSALALAAFIFSTSATFDCSFFHIRKQISEVKIGFGVQHTHTSTIKVGIWTTEEDWAFATPETVDLDSLYAGSFATFQDEWTQGSQSCVAWFNSKLGKLPDGPVKFTRMLSLVVFIGGILLLTLMISHAVWDPLFCVTEERINATLPDRQNWPTFRVATVAAVGCGMMALYTALFLSVLGTEACAEDRVDRCRLAAGGYLCLFSVILWTSAALVMWFWGHVTAPVSTSDRGLQDTKEAPPTLKDMQELDATDVDEENTMSEE